MSKPPRIALIHIGKTGGMWLRFALEEFFQPDEVCRLQHELQFPADLSTLNHFNLFDAHIGYDVASRLDAELITVLRNPYDRVASLYHYWRGASVDRGLPQLAKSMSFDRFLESTNDPLIESGLVNTQTWQLAYSHTIDSRDRHRGICAEALLERAKQNLRQLAVVGVQEDVPTLAVQIAAKLGLRIDLAQPRANTTKSRPCFSQMSLETRAKIHPLIAVDLALYDHVLNEYVFPARGWSEDLARLPKTAAPQRLGPAIRKAVSINGIRKLVGV